MELRVGYVAGAIAAAIFLARIWSPNVVTFIISGVLRDTNTAATWTAASTALQRSHWPWVLQSDSAKNHGVRKDIFWLTWFITAMSFIIAIAGVVTPLGLYEVFLSSGNTYALFSYAKDPSSFGYGTPVRSSLPFNRVCTAAVNWAPCPFSKTIAVVKQDGRWVNTSYPYGYDIDIPTSLFEAYSSGTDNSTTISNFFDVEWRRYQQTYDKNFDILNNGSEYLVGSSRVMESLALNDDVEPIEGLLVDSRTGGIGFRNHTVPLGFEHGVTWKEDILFIEPETSCVDTNLTIDYEIASIDGVGTIANMTLIDRGGFVNLKREYPRIDLTNTQSYPKLQERAYKAAWTANYLMAIFYNVTNAPNGTTGLKSFQYLNSKMDEKFHLPNLKEAGDYDSLSLSDRWGRHLDFTRNRSVEEGEVNLPPSTNPFRITATNFTDISTICAGAAGGDYANITNILVKCGLMRGIPKRLDTTGSASPLVFDLGSRWSQPMYACASATKATIKTVHFRFNGTQGLRSLKVDKLEPKTYSDATSLPLWGVEYTGNKLLNHEIELLWGLIDNKYENHPNISTVRQESLYLPGYIDFESEKLQARTIYNIPMADFYKTALGTAYVVTRSAFSEYKNVLADYTGTTNMAQWARWQNLSATPETAGRIPNLIFTDYAAASVLGTKGIRGWRNEGSDNVIPVLVSPTVRRIRYHLPFAIPAFIAILGLILMTLGALITMLFRHHNIQALKLQLQKLSPGRIFTTFLHPELGGMSISSKDWSRTIGHTVIDMTTDYPFSAATVPLQPILGHHGPGEKRPNAFETSVSEGSTERDHFLHGSSPPIPQPYTGVRQHSPVSPISRS